MKTKLFFLLTIILFFGVTISAQTSFSCHYREYCDWNESSEKFVNCKGSEEASLFVMNKDQTMFTHTTESMKSTYYVNEEEYDSEKELWFYTVTSDVGNKYIFIFDPNNKEIRAIITRDDEMILLRFYVKAIF
jgi:hypothetical protein